MFSKKFKILETLLESLGYLKNHFLKYIVNTLMIIASQFLGVVIISAMILATIGRVYSTTSGASVTTVLDSPKLLGLFPNTMAMLLLFIPLIVLVVILHGVYIKITDDIYEKRESRYGQQLKFVFVRGGRFILSSLILSVPIFLAGVVIAILGQITLIPIIIIVAVIVNILMLMINQSIVVEDNNTIEAIKSSVSIMKHNWLRFLFFVLFCSSATGSLGNLITSNSESAGRWLFLALQVLLLPLPMILNTLLFKSVDHTPYDQGQSDDYYVDSSELYFDYDEE